MINIPSWMFLSSFEKLRVELLERSTISSLLHLGRGIFGSDFGTVAYTALNRPPTSENVGVYRRLFEAHVDVRPPEKIRQLFLDHEYNRFCVSQLEFEKIPGRPFAYWPTREARNAFQVGRGLDEIADIGKGFDTGDNERFLRVWHEVGSPSTRWKPCQKGGPYRKWYGNNDFAADWNNGGQDLKDFPKSNLRNAHNYFKSGASWTRVSSGSTAFRYFPEGQLFESTGPCLFPHSASTEAVTAFLNSKVTFEFLKVLAPMLDFQSGHISKLPWVADEKITKKAEVIGAAAIDLARSDWDAYETSWDFKSLPLLSPDYRGGTLTATYSRLRAHWQDVSDEMKGQEEENNRIFIDAYGLQDELTPEVPVEEITLTCNPAHRYGGKASPEELEERLRADTLAEFLHYAVGCMFGRYSLDASGLILANQGEGLAEYLARVPSPSFEIDADNVIPVLDSEWFADDITGRFRKFLRVTFGEAKFQENLAFIEAALGKDVRKWFTKDFFDYHVRRFKKRPIYWMFSSPKGSFNALIYMHRYRPDTVSIVLNDYLREFISKLQAERSRLEKLADDPAANQTQRTRALKDVATVIKQIDELEDWEREVVFPLAQARIEIDLDDGVKRNYPKLGAALKPIKGLETADE